MDSIADDDDARAIELDTLAAIWPEIRRLSDQPSRGALVFELELPVEPARPVTVLFPAASAPPLHQAGVATEPVDSLLVSHLPPLSLRISLPDGYPETRPLQAVVSTTPSWLSRESLARLEDEASRLWSEAGHDLVAYAYIDHVQRAAEDVFDAVSPDGTLELDPAHKLAVLDYDVKAKRAAFDKESFECGVCLDPKRGSSCHKMVDCGHIFCLGCLRDFYGDAIEQGNISTVRCLTPNCAKQRAAAAAASGGDSSRRSKRPKTFISPSELLQIGLSGDVVERYVTLKYKTELESDKDTIYCPRQWCNGAARSKKHKKPDGLELADVSDAESEPEPDDEGDEAAKAKFNPADLLCVCDDCGFAFCARCLQTWHGEFVRCAPRRDKDELTEEEKASIEYLQLHTSPCPTCSAPAQKTFGCNHMICSRCDTHYCYLCSSWLDPVNPYQHYNQQPNGKVTSCYMRLWELEDGDGDDVGLAFHGGIPRDPRLGDDAADESDDDEPESEDDADVPLQPPPPPQQRDRRPLPAGAAAGPVAVAREAPLVLRLVENQQPRQGPEQAAEPVQNQPGGGARNRRGAVAARGRGAPARAMEARGRGPGRGARAGGRGARPGRGGAGAGPGPGRQPLPPAVDEEAGLDEAGAAWVRRFVAMALMDIEDEDGDDSDGERA